MTERYAMNGFQLVRMVSRLARGPRTRRAALPAALAAIALAAIGTAWFAGMPRHIASDPQPRALHTTLADSPSWDRVKAAWPKYMPALPAESPAAVPQAPGMATVTPAVIHGPAETPAPPPSIIAGPELFARTATGGGGHDAASALGAGSERQFRAVGRG